jgi:DNA gyrase subunit A
VYLLASEYNDSSAYKSALLAPVAIENEMRSSYLDYAMSVIVSRALPDCRDGMKPVHRRIVYAMHETNNYHDKPYKKSARVVGDVVGKYHPHGTDPVYGALVRLAQPFSLRHPLIDGQGNFGSMDGDAPAQMRYTEARLAKISVPMMQDIEFDTVKFNDNYDGSEKEPSVLPARFPNLLINGSSGIAVGMATNIPTHNLGEVIDACIAYIQNPEISIQELIEYVPAPDFPTGGIILGEARSRTALATGRGSIIMRAKTEFEEIGGRQAIVVTEIPYQVNKAELVKRIGELVRDKVIEGIAEIRDESNKLGIKIVIELKKNAFSEVVLSCLYKYTALQTSFGVNMLALDKGQPRLMNLRDVIAAFIDFREEVVTKRTTFLLNRARDKAHILLGLMVAVSNIDAVIALIKASPDAQTAKERLMQQPWHAKEVISLLKVIDDHRIRMDGESCYFTEEQAKAILEMRLQRLTNMESQKISDDLNALAVEIAGYLEILNSRVKLMEVISHELSEVKAKHATPRLTQIEVNENEVELEDLIKREAMVVTTTLSGYIKRVPLATYRAQRRGGKGRSGMSIYEDDITNDVIITDTHAHLLFFSSAGKVYRTKVYKLPQGTPQSKGRALINIFPLAENEKINNIMPVPDDLNADKLSIIFATNKGTIRRNSFNDFANINAGGKIAIRLDENDKLIGVQICNEDDHIMLSTKSGKAIRFPVEILRVFKSRTSEGVRGAKLAPGDEVIALSVLNGVEFNVEKREQFLKLSAELRIKIQQENDALTEETKQEITNEIAANQLDISVDEVVNLSSYEQFILSITENGYGKRTSAFEYRVSGRGGQGIASIATSERNGDVVSSFPVLDHQEIMLITDGGTLIRTAVNSIRITGRTTAGVKVIDIKPGEKVISAAVVMEGDINQMDNPDNSDT